MNSKNNKLGVSVSGLGVGEKHARFVKKSKRTNLISVYDNNLVKAKKISKKINSKYEKNFLNLISDKKTNILVIASPDNFHAAQIIKSFNYNKHIFVEKPLCTEQSELKNIFRKWKFYNGKLKLASNLILRTAPIYLWLKKKIKENYFGKIYSFEAEYLYGRIEKVLNGWRGFTKNYSVMKGGGVHMIDLMCWLNNEMPKEVISHGNNICLKNTRSKILDYMTSTFTFKSGMIGHVSANFGCVHKHQHTIKIYGTKKTFIYDDSGPRVHFTRDPKKKSKKINIKTLPKNKSQLLDIFIKNIIKNANYNSHTIKEFKLASVLIGCDESMKKKKKIKIKYIC